MPFMLFTHSYPFLSPAHMCCSLLYIGDGNNDICPSTLLTPSDIVFPRLGYPLAKELNDDGTGGGAGHRSAAGVIDGPEYRVSGSSGVSARVVEWENARIIWNVCKSMCA